MCKLELPLKSEIPCLEYDYAAFCKALSESLPPSLPAYLESYQKRLFYYAGSVHKLLPSSFPKAYRVYIIDCRLNILFAALDPTGKMATYFSKYGHASHTMEDYYFGDGSTPDAQKLSGPGFTYDFKQMAAFSKKYGFLPIEEMSLASAVIYNGPDIAERRLLSQYQVQLLSEKFHGKNLVDWRMLINRTQSSFSL